MPKPVLGRGLGALLGGVPASAESATPEDVAVRPDTSESESNGDAGETVRRVPLDQIRPCPLQPRREFAQESLEELAYSIREQGILQPLIVRRQGKVFELIAGERRWRAAQLLKMAEVPVLVRQADDQEVLELALVENLQRDNLNPLEEALGYSRLVDEFKLRQEDVAEKVGKSRTSVANALRLLKLPQPVQRLLRDGRLSVGHAKVILGLSDPERQQSAAERVLRDQLNVRQTEGLVSKLQKPRTQPANIPAGNHSSSSGTDAYIEELQDRIRERFGTRVHLHCQQGKGYLQIKFFNSSDLERILQLAGVKMDA